MEILKEVSFKELDKWFVSYYLNPFTMESVHPLINLSEIIYPRKDRISKKGYNNDIPVIKKISFKDGKIHLRDKKETGMDLYKISKNELLVSKINFHQGAISINNFGELVCSTHYQPYRVSETIIKKEYLTLCLRSDSFLKFIKYLRADGIKNEATYEFIGKLKIPLPPLAEQNRIVANYNANIKLANEKEEKAKQLEQEIENYLFEVLGIEKLEDKENVKGLQFVDLHNTSRWDTLFLIGSIPKLKAKYEIRKFSDVISTFNKGHNNISIRINSKDFPEGEFRYIGMEHIEKETGNLLELKKVKGKEIKSQTLKVPKGFLLYGKLRPYLNKYWINKTNYSNIICSSEFFVFDIINDIGKDYFLNVLSSQFIQSQISDKTSGARMPRINEEIFFNLQFPLPSLKIQAQIANHISALKQQIKDLQSQAKENREKAIQEFEEKIFTKS